MEKWGCQNEVAGKSKKSRGEVKMKWGEVKREQTLDHVGRPKKKQRGCQKEVAKQ